MIINNVAHTTFDTPVWDGTGWTLVFTCDEGYYFVAGTLAIQVLSASTGGYINITLNRNDDNTQGTRYYTGEHMNAKSDFFRTVGTVAAVPTPVITNNVENTTVEYSGANPFTLTLIANDGYKFTEAPKAVYTNSSGYPRSENFVISSDGKKATLTTQYAVVSPYNITLTGTTTPETVAPTINNNVEETTVSYSGSNPFTLTLQANDGYKFDTCPTATYYNEDGEAQTDTFQLSEDWKTATLTTAKLDSSLLTITVNGTTTPETVAPTITNNIANTTATYSGSDHQYVITIKANDGYLLDGTPEASYIGYSSGTSVSVSFAVASDSKSASGVCPDVDENTPIILTGNTKVEPTGSTTVKTSLTNCTVAETLPTTITGGETLTVTVKANDNTHFEVIPKFTWDNESGYYETQNLTLSEDSKTATGTFTNPDYIPQAVTIAANAVPDAIIGTNYGAIHVYKVTLDNLNDFSKKRFFKESEDDGSVTLINLGDYVNRIKRVFFTVPTASTDVIKCGNYNTGVECEAPQTDTVTLNFGAITVPTPNGDATDYLSELKLFVPFSGFVSVPVDYIGKTLSLVYTVNVITGGGVAKLLCGEDVVLLVDVEPNEDIIYQTNLDNLATVGGDEWNEKLLYGVEPFLQVRYYDSLNKEERNNDYVNAKLGDMSGFCVVDDVTLSTTAEMTAEEQGTIITLLKQGVYIEQ